MSVSRLLIICPDRPGIVATVSSFLYERGANILDAAQHTTDAEAGTFFMRLEYALDTPDAGPDVEAAFARDVTDRFQMTFRFSDCDVRKRIAILVSRSDHCLLELLWQWRRGELGADVVQVVSNQPDLEDEVRRFELPYAHIPVVKEARSDAESELLGLIRDRVDLVVLARYMQILSGDFIERVTQSSLAL